MPILGQRLPNILFSMARVAPSTVFQWPEFHQSLNFPWCFEWFPRWCALMYMKQMIIAGRSGSGNLANVSAGRLNTLGEDLILLSAAYQNVVLDLGAGVDRTVRNLANNVDKMMVITTDEPTALTDAYAFIKITHMERPNTDIRIVVNMANSNKEGEKTYNTILKACEGFLKFSPQLAGVIRRDAKVRDSIRAQEPLLTRFPNTEAANDVTNIVKNLEKD